MLTFLNTISDYNLSRLRSWSRDSLETKKNEISIFYSLLIDVSIAITNSVFLVMSSYCCFLASYRNKEFLLRPRERLQSIVMCVCLSVREDISGTSRAIFTKFSVHVAYVRGRGSVLLRRCCDTLCTSDFVDDIMFFSIMGRIAV